MISNIINMVLSALVLICWVLIAARCVINSCASVKVVRAKVVDKYKQRTITKFYGTFMREGCVIVLEANGKRLSFSVSEFSYDGYALGETGTLKYKGNRLISFE